MNYWLLKSEPDTWSWVNQLARGKEGEVWSGVRNYQAANFLKEMRKGDLAFFYHSGKNPNIVGIVSVIREHYTDPTDKSKKFVAITVIAKTRLTQELLKRPVTLKEIKAESSLKELLLVKQPRLSVMPIGALHWEKILKLSRHN
jgi:predicted RNA-binding protein with PUA-like domain